MKKHREFTEKEKKWLSSFKRVMKKAPSTLFLFVGAGVSVYAKDENNHRYMTDSGSVDQEAACCSIITEMEADGGDY